MLFGILVGKQNGNINLFWSSLQMTTEGSKYKKRMLLLWNDMVCRIVTGKQNSV